MIAIEHRQSLALALANSNVNGLLAELAEALAQIDTLKANEASLRAENAELKSKLPEAPAA